MRTRLEDITEKLPNCPSCRVPSLHSRRSRVNRPADLATQLSYIELSDTQATEFHGTHIPDSRALFLLEPTGWQTDEQYWLMLLQGHAFLPLSRRQIPLQWHTDILSVFGTCVACSISLCSISSNVKLSSIIDVGASVNVMNAHYFM